MIRTLNKLYLLEAISSPEFTNDPNLTVEYEQKDKKSMRTPP